MLIECALSKLIINEVRDQQIVTLREVSEPNREFPIVIGMFEALAIDRRLKGVEVPRPMTHDLIVSAIDDLGGRLTRVIVNDLRDNTFFARIEVEMPNQDENLLIDSRPSDALAVSVRAGCRVFVDEAVFKKVELSG
jgi:bifunctional DNase/RNase